MEKLIFLATLLGGVLSNHELPTVAPLSEPFPNGTVIANPSVITVEEEMTDGKVGGSRTDVETLAASVLSNHELPTVAPLSEPFSNGTLVTKPSVITTEEEMMEGEVGGSGTDVEKIGPVLSTHELPTITPLSEQPLNGTLVVKPSVITVEEEMTEGEVVGSWTDVGRYSNESITSLGSRRMRRARHPCWIPIDKHSHIQLSYTLRKKEIIQKCVWGYTVNGRKQRKYTCDDKHGVWKPSFQYCKESVNCDLRMTGAGRVKCMTNLANKGPQCQIWCAKKGKRPHIATRVYGCQPKGNWIPKLPHCVKPVEKFRIYLPAAKKS